MAQLRILGAISIILLASQAYSQEPRWFSLERCAWNATDVVVITEGDVIDGQVTVTETWKGSLAPGRSIVVPALAAFRSWDSRLVGGGLFVNADGTKEYVSGSRVVLFLKRNDPLVASANRNNPASEWEPASSRAMSYSIVWIEGEKTYTSEEVNSGLSILFDQRKSEGELKELTRGITNTRDAYDRAIKIADLATRARNLAPLTESKTYLAQQAAFRSLGECGPGALPVVEEILNDHSRIADHPATIGAMVEIGGTRVGADLTRLVIDELEYWKKTLPDLRYDWWRAGPEPSAQSKAARFGRLYTALGGLLKLNFPGCESVVAELRDFWRSSPLLEDDRGLNVMSELCDAVLANLKAH